MGEAKNRNQSEKMFFLNGWIGMRLAEQWLMAKGFCMERSIPQRRGTENAVSSGDIDLIASKPSKSETIYVEVKFWGSGSKPYSLTPSWLVEGMLNKNKLNTLFESHKEATGYMLIYRTPAFGTFVYDKEHKYINQLISKYEVPRELIQELSGRSSQEFAENILRFIVQERVGMKVKFEIVYFQQILKEIGQEKLDSYQLELMNELATLFESIYSDIVKG